MSAQSFLGKPLSPMEQHVVTALVEHEGVPLSAMDLLSMIPINRDPALRQSPLRRLYVFMMRIQEKGVPLGRQVSPAEWGVARHVLWSLKPQVYQAWLDRWFPVQPPLAPSCEMLRQLPTNWRPLVADIAAVYAVAPDDVIGPSLKKPIVVARHDVWFRLHKDGGRSHGDIARRFGRDPSAVSYGIRRHVSRLLGEARPC